MTSVLARATVVAVLLVGAAGVPARAAFHLMKITEVFPGTPANPDAQYVELQMYAGGQNVVGGHAVRILDASGTEVGRATFPSSVASGADQATILVATTQAQALFSLTADLTLGVTIPLAGGAVCFDSIDCVAWGAYTGSPSGVGTPLNGSEGLVLGSSATRDISRGSPTRLESGDDTGDSRADFAFRTPSPRNNAGVNGVIAFCAATFASASATVDESSGSAVITVTACPNAEVTYSTADGTATAGSDYIATSGTLTFAAGESSKTFGVVVIDGPSNEPTETVALRLRNPQSAYLNLPNATLSITDSSPPMPPSAPRSLTATGGLNQISLSWLAPVDTGSGPVTGYNVYRGHTSGAGTFLATTAGLTYADAGLGDGVTRYYTVTAVNAGGEGPRSNEATATTDDAAVLPSPPRDPVVTPGRQQLAFAWQAPSSDGGSPILGYRVYEGASALALALVADVGPGVSSFTRTGLTDGATRFYAAVAYNANGAGPRSAEISGTTFALPSAPRALTATGGNGRITLAWQGPLTTGGTAVTNYRVWRGPVAGQETPLLMVGTTLTFDDTPLPAGATRAYRIAAINEVGEGPLSTPSVTATTFAPPSEPRQLRATPGATVGEIALSWIASASNGGSPITGYVVLRQSSGEPEAPIAEVTGLTFVDRDRTPGTKYEYRVAARNVVGIGSASLRECQRPFPWHAALGCTV